MAERTNPYEPFSDSRRSREAERLGMLVFLATEIMLFGALFAAALAMRLTDSAGYGHASERLHLWIGGFNTAILLTSSLCVALAVEAVRAHKPRLAAWLIGGAAALGFAFLALKGVEYTAEYHEGMLPGLSEAGITSRFERLFMDLYFSATGLHGLHVTIGVVLLLSLIWPFGRARRDPHAMFVANAALYWHLVDIVWLFLYPTLYLAKP